jgi:hypothetical protein
MRHHVILVENNLCVAAPICHPGAIGLAHVHAYLNELVPVSFVLFPFLDEAFPGGFVPAFGRKENRSGGQISKDGQVMTPFADAHFIHPHLCDFAHVLGPESRIHMGKEHPP